MDENDSEIPIARLSHFHSDVELVKNCVSSCCFFFFGGGGSKCVTKWQFLLIF